jgi:ribonuclease I
VNNLPAGANEHAPAWFYGLGEHEWEKHGSCADAMNLDLSTDQAQRVYFNTTYDAFSRKKEFVVTSSIGKSVPAKELYDKLEFSSGLGCTPKCELEALFTCWSKDSQNLPLQQIPCPAVGIINSEYSNGCQKCTEITIPEFPCSNDNQLF